MQSSHKAKKIMMLLKFEVSATLFKTILDMYTKYIKYTEQINTV